MKLRIHSAILATTLAATAAVGLASASFIAAPSVAAKADRLPLVAAANASYLTIETRRDGISVLRRIPVNGLD